MIFRMYWKEKISPLILYLSPAQPQSRRSLSAYSKEMLIGKYGKEEANKRIYATTDKAKGALKNLGKRRGIRELRCSG